MKIPKIFKFGDGGAHASAIVARKLFLFFLGVSIIPLVIISGATYFYGRAILETKAIESLSALVESKAEHADLFIEKLKTRVVDWSLDGKIRENAEKIQSECSRGAAISSCPLARELSMYLKDKKLPIDPVIVLVDILDISGVVVASSDINRFGMDEGRERISFSEAMALPFGEAIFTPELVVEEDELASRPMFHLIAPLISIETGKTIGAILIHILSDEFNNILATNYGETSEVYIVNHDRLMITPSRFVAGTVLEQSVNTPVVRACLDRGKDYQGQYLNYRSQQVIGVSKCISEGLGVLVAEMDSSEAFAAIFVFRNAMLALLAVVLFFVTLYGFFAGRKLLPELTVTTTTTATAVTIATVVVIVVIGAIFSISFSKMIEQFIFRVKIESVQDLIHGQFNRHIGKAEYFINWQTAESQSRLEDFVSELKISLPSVVALKVYDNKAILIWSDLVKEKIGMIEESEDVFEALRGGQKIEIAEEEIQKELGLSDFLEIYTPVSFEGGDAPVGVVEVYFDISDLTAFIRKLQFYIWGIIFVSLVIIYSLLHFAFKRQNEQITHQANELALIINNSPHGIYTLNKDGVIESFNPKMLEIVGGKNTEELVGSNALELPAYKAVGLDKLFREGLDGKVFETEVKYASYAEGKITWRHYFGVPIVASGGIVAKLLLMVEDITRRKELEEKFAVYTEGLEKEVAARTKILREKVDELERINKFMVGRELKMAELKEELQKLKTEK